MKPMFKIGYKVKLVTNKCMSCHEIGHIGYITDCNFEPGKKLMYRISPVRPGNWSYEEDLELVEPTENKPAKKKPAKSWVTIKPLPRFSDYYYIILNKRCGYKMYSDYYKEKRVAVQMAKRLAKEFGIEYRESK